MVGSHGLLPEQGEDGIIRKTGKLPCYPEHGGAEEITGRIVRAVKIQRRRKPYESISVENSNKRFTSADLAEMHCACKSEFFPVKCNTEYSHGMVRLSFIQF